MSHIDEADDENLYTERQCFCHQDDCWECETFAMSDPIEGFARMRGASHVIHDLGNGVLIGKRLRYEQEDADATGVP